MQLGDSCVACSICAVPSRLWGYKLDSCVAGGDCQEQAGSGAGHPEAVRSAVPGPLREAAGCRVGRCLPGHHDPGLPLAPEAHR